MWEPFEGFGDKLNVFFFSPVVEGCGLRALEAYLLSLPSGPLSKRVPV